MKKRILILGLVIILTPILAGLYGVIHDQLTYSISHEYYTEFKFQQFGIAEEGAKCYFPDRVGAAYVGFMATWWTGIPIGLILGLVGLIHKDWRNMFRITIRSLLLTLIISLATGLIGLFYGRLFLIHSDLNWYFPDHLIYRTRFIMVGSMHNFSYLGGLIGLIIGIIYQIRQKRKTGGNTVYAP